MVEAPPKHVNVRMSEALLERIRKAATADQRSLNAEILVALDEWLRGRGRRR